MLSYEEQLIEKINFKKKKSLTVVIYDALKEAIIDGVIPIGHRINEQSLAKVINISRTPIRAAFKMLVKEQLLEYESNRGVIVRNINEQTISEFFNIRLQLERLLFEEAMKKITSEQLSEILSYFYRLKVFEKNNQYEQIIDVLAEYHASILKIAKAPILESMLNNLNANVDCLQVFDQSNPRRQQIAIREQLNIILSLAQKEEKILEMLLTKYMINSEKAVLKDYYQKVVDKEVSEAVDVSQNLFVCKELRCPLYNSVNTILSQAFHDQVTN